MTPCSYPNHISIPRSFTLIQMSPVSTPSRSSAQLTTEHLPESNHTNHKYVSYSSSQTDMSEGSIVYGQHDHNPNLNKSDCLEYWRTRLASVTPTVFPLSSYHTAPDSSIRRCFTVAHASLTLDRGIELPTLATLAYALVLSAHSGSSDEVLFGRVCPRQG